MAIHAARRQFTINTFSRWLVLLVGVLLPANSLMAQPLPIILEQQRGQAIAAAMEIRYGKLSDPRRQRRVDGIVRRLETAAMLPPGSITVRLLDSDECNALALPGNVLCVTRGLVDGAPSSNALAGALAHEVAHLLLGHARQMLTTRPERRRLYFSVETLLPNGEIIRREVREESPYQLPDLRAKEQDADRESLLLLQKAGYPSTAALEILEYLCRREAFTPQETSLPDLSLREFLTAHPPAAERIRQLRAYLQEKQPATELIR